MHALIQSSRSLCFHLSLFIFAIIEKPDLFQIWFNGKNYLALEFQFWMFVEGKELCGFVDGKMP